MHTPTPPATPFSLAALLVRATPATLPEVLMGLRALPGVDVHHVDDATGRAVVTLEIDPPADEQPRLEAIRHTPGVLTAELVYHYVEGAERR